MIERVKIIQELKQLNIPYSKFDLIQNKDGIVVARVQSDEKSYIIKSLYIGGGTPTILDSEQLDRLLSVIDYNVLK